MAGILKLEEQFAILSEAERPSSALRVLKHGDTFAVFGDHGDIVPGPGSPYGVYHEGTRFLSRLELLLANRQPLLLSSNVAEDNAAFSADLTNPDMVSQGRVVLERGLVHLFRSRVLGNGTAVERIRVSNHALDAVEVPLAVRFAADFADVFEVRGTRRERRGEPFPDVSDHNGAVLRYRGLDGVERRTRIHCTRPPTRDSDGTWLFLVPLEPRASEEIEIAIAFDVSDRAPALRRFDESLSAARARPSLGEAAVVRTSNASFDRWMGRSIADLRMLMSDTAGGPYPYAGIPWFSAPFGRDGILTAIELLWLAPTVARGVLTFLARTQATTTSAAQDAQPGKILHEMREGEMAALGEIPFGRYYGSADATPLFVVLAHAYFERTGDLALMDAIWPNVCAALQWMDVYGDVDGDGFIEYARRSASGLVQQGWKDSWDSVFHADGALAEPPIALCEIQAYAYAAWNGAAKLAAARGDTAESEIWSERAAALQNRFERAFWSDDLGTYALALDARKQPCRVRTSNAGHCLFAGIASPERARIVADTLISESSFSGWGIRTVASGMSRYNPMSYHNGSVWPHDNAIIASGFARYGLTALALEVFRAMFDLSQMVDLHRLPELVCGFHRRADSFPTLYPVACAPQAWAAAAVSLLLQACLGVHIDAPSRRVSFANTVLPEEIESVEIANLGVADARVDLLLTRQPHDVGLTVLRRAGDVAVTVVK